MKNILKFLGLALLAMFVFAACDNLATTDIRQILDGTYIPPAAAPLQIVSISPVDTAGTTTAISVTFNQAVTINTISFSPFGVVSVNSSTGTGAGPYNFLVTALSAGTVQVTFITNRGSVTSGDVAISKAPTTSISLTMEDASGNDVDIADETIGFPVVDYGYTLPLTPVTADDFDSITVKVTNDDPDEATGLLGVSLTRHSNGVLSSAAAFSLNSGTPGASATISSIDGGDDDSFTVAIVDGLDAGDYMATVSVTKGGVTLKSFVVSFTVEKLDLDDYVNIDYDEDDDDWNETANTTTHSTYSDYPLTITLTNNATESITVAIAIDDTGNFTLSDATLTIAGTGGTRTFTITPKDSIDPEGDVCFAYDVIVTLSAEPNYEGGDFKVTFKIEDDT